MLFVEQQYTTEAPTRERLDGTRAELRVQFAPPSLIRQPALAPHVALSAVPQCNGRVTTHLLTRVVN